MKVAYKIIIALAALGALLSPFSPLFEKNAAYAQTVPIYTADQGQYTPQVQTPSPNEAPKIGELPSCVGLASGFSFYGCVANFFYIVAYVPTSFLVYIGGSFLDFFVHYSIDHYSYRSDFVENGWKLTRDIANIFFIIILIYTAVSTVLDIGPNAKQVIVNVVIIALLINFSLFFSKVIVDSSNILARIFYDAVIIKDSSGQEIAASFGGEKSISRAIMSHIEPQKLMDPSIFTGEAASDYNSTYIIVIIISSIINLVLMYVFFSVGFLFLWRIIGLWVSMIFAPLAFVTYILPKTQSIDGFGWSKWIGGIIELAFMAPIFSFFMYLILKFAEIGQVLPDPASGVGWFKRVVYIILPLAFIAALLIKAKNLATKYSGEGGKMFAKAGEALGGMALGAVGGAYMGGTAALGRATAGRVGRNIAESRFLKNAELQGGIFGAVAEKTRDLGRYTGKASFEFRNTAAGKNLAKETGVNYGEGKKGGFYASREEQRKKQDEKAKDLINAAPEEEQIAEIRRRRRELNNLIEQNHAQRSQLLENLDDEREQLQRLRDSGLANTDPQIVAAQAAVTAAATQFATFEQNAGIRDARREVNRFESRAKRVQEDRTRQAARYTEATPLGRGWRRVKSGGEYNQTEAYVEADNLRKDLKS